MNYELLSYELLSSVIIEYLMVVSCHSEGDCNMTRGLTDWLSITSIDHIYLEVPNDNDDDDDYGMCYY